jgi:hypothetical protein
VRWSGGEPQLQIGAEAGLALDALWEHLVWPRFLDDIQLTMNGAVLVTVAMHRSW